MELKLISLNFFTNLTSAKEELIKHLWKILSELIYLIIM